MNENNGLDLLALLAADINTTVRHQRVKGPGTQTASQFSYVELNDTTKLYYFDNDPRHFTLSIEGHGCDRISATLDNIAELSYVIKANMRSTSVIRGKRDSIEEALRDLVACCLKNGHHDWLAEYSSLPLGKMQDLLSDFIEQALQELTPDLVAYADDLHEQRLSAGILKA